MDVNTARKYLNARRLPSEMKAVRHWRTRPDGFAEVWAEISERLRTNHALEAKAIFEAVKRQYPEEPAQEIYFVEEHRAGELCEYDFTHLTELGITIAGEPVCPHALPLRADVLELRNGTICLFVSRRASPG
jgi:hypothetical protein